MKKTNQKAAMTTFDNLWQPQKGCNPFVYRCFDNLATFFQKKTSFCSFSFKRWNSSISPFLYNEANGIRLFNPLTGTNDKSGQTCLHPKVVKFDHFKNLGNKWTLNMRIPSSCDCIFDGKFVPLHAKTILDVMNFIFISPHFPHTYWEFCHRLKQNELEPSPE